MEFSLWLATKVQKPLVLGFCHQSWSLSGQDYTLRILEYLFYWNEEEFLVGELLLAVVVASRYGCYIPNLLHWYVSQSLPVLKEVLSYACCFQSNLDKFQQFYTRSYSEYRSLSCTLHIPSVIAKPLALSQLSKATILIANSVVVLDSRRILAEAHSPLNLGLRRCNLSHLLWFCPQKPCKLCLPSASCSPCLLEYCKSRS